MYKLSEYNSVYDGDRGEIILYNRLTDKILRTKQEGIKKIVLDGVILQTEVPQILIDNGFIVQKNVEEKHLEYLKNYDSISNTELKLIILPTYKCNFRCTYCYQDFKVMDMDNDMANRVINFVKREIHKYSGLSIGWYGGEPLLCSNIINRLSQEFISICHSTNRKYSATITTNGYLLNNKMFQQMLKNRISLYQITIDGIKEIHDQDRKLIDGTGSFDRIIYNLKDISQNNQSRIFKIKIRSNMQENRIEEYNQFIKILYDNFGKDKRFTYWFTAVSNYGGSSIYKISNLMNSFDKLYDLLINSKYNLDYSPFYYHMITRSCIAAHRNCYIVTPNCLLLKCSIDLEKEYNHVGNINEKGIPIIDNYKLAKWLHYERDLASSCNSCKNADNCINFACPKVNNFPDEGINCTKNFINEEKIIKLLCKRDYSFIQKY